MQYLEALTPPTVMAIAFSFLIRALFRNQGGANAAKEDAVADAIRATQVPSQPEH